MEEDVKWVNISIKVVETEFDGFLLAGNICTNVVVDQSITKWVDLSMFMEDSNDTNYSYYSTPLNDLLSKYGCVLIKIINN